LSRDALHLFDLATQSLQLFRITRQPVAEVPLQPAGSSRMRGDNPGTESEEPRRIGTALLVEQISDYYSFAGASFWSHRRYGALHDDRNDKTNLART
jgi:hypothetical protein